MYKAKVLEQFEFNPGGWKGIRVGVFKIEGSSEIQVGEYQRNIGGFYNTFLHFQREGKDLALYSPDYTCTRIMELPSCEDIGGEEPNGMGFCPVDYFVPSYIDQEVTRNSTNDAFPAITSRVERVNNPDAKALMPSSHSSEYVNGNTGQKCTDVWTYQPLTRLTYYPFAFVAGCVWADDSSWKVQYLDLSAADQGILKREARFGYIELPDRDSLRLKDLIEMDSFDNDPDEDYSSRIRINIMQTFDLRTGTRIDPAE
jgi:hypothetical protein